MYKIICQIQGIPVSHREYPKLPSVLCPKLLPGQAFGSRIRPQGQMILVQNLCSWYGPDGLAHLHCLKDL